MERFDDEGRGYLAALCSALALALTSICIRYLYTKYQIDPLILAFWRNALLVAALFFILELAYPKLVEISSKDLYRVLGFGLVLALFNYLWTLSVTLNGAAVATFLVYSSVPLTAVLGWLVLGEKPPAGMFSAICCSVLGCLLISGAWSEADVSLSPGGIIAGIGSGGCFAIYSLIGRFSRQRGMNAWTFMLYCFGSAALFLLISEIALLGASGTPFRPVAAFFSLGGALSGWSLLFFLAVGPTLLGYGLYTLSLGYLPSGIVNLISTLEPPFAAVLAYLLLGELLSLLQVVGAALIIGAVLILRLTRPAPTLHLRLKHRVVHHSG
ncbi:MAG: EamA family transporter [Desulfofustis sp.]|jgi:drug/metabolite transporter (DMT)-like permease|nr:EamA family transporter [Desulfofustis sp.]